MSITSKTKSHNATYVFYTQDKLLSKCNETSFDSHFGVDFSELVMDCPKCNLKYEIFDKIEQLCNELEGKKKEKMIKRLRYRKDNLEFYIEH